MQSKWLTLLNVTMHGYYYMETSAAGLSRIARHLDELQVQAFGSIFRIDARHPDLQVQLFHPIEDGGFGLLPYTDMALHARERMLARSDTFIERFGFTRQEHHDVPTCDLRQLWLQHLRPTVFGTRDFKVQRAAKSWIKLSPQGHETFLRIAPSNGITTFRDDDFCMAVHHRLHRITPPPGFKCPRQPDIAITTETFGPHVNGCTTCAKDLFYRRHQAVLHAIYHACRFHGYDSKLVATQSAEDARPERSRGGADLMVYTNGNTYALDVTICKETAPTESTMNRLHSSYVDKINLYQQYQQANVRHVVVPFAMTIYGLVHQKSVDHITDIAKQMRTNVKFRTDLLRHTQCTLQKAISRFFTDLAVNYSSTSVPLTNSVPPPQAVQKALSPIGHKNKQKGRCTDEKEKITGYSPK